MGKAKRRNKPSVVLWALKDKKKNSKQGLRYQRKKIFVTSL